MREGRLDVLVRDLTAAYLFYRERCGSETDFFRLPVIGKSTIAEQPSWFMHPDPPARLWESYTSGSTGVPFRCVKSESEKQTLSFAILSHRRGWGLPLRHTSLLLSNRFLDEPHMMAHYADCILRGRPQMIQGRSSALAALAAYMADNGLAVPESLRFVQNWGEPLQPAHKAAVERAFGVPFYDYYGMEEIWPIAFSDAEGHLVVDERMVFLEVLNPETDRPVPEGEFGELVVTSFVMRSMPFVRYRTGDIGSVRRDPATGKLILSLLPVRSTQIRLPGRQAQPAIFRYLDKYFYELSLHSGVRQFQIVQESYTAFRLKIAAPSGELDTAALAARLQNFLKQYLALEVNVGVESVPFIAPDPVSGKYHPFVSFIP